ncbi:hypothetical protein ACOMHN_065516 [Nucella lapillus]
MFRSVCRSYRLLNGLAVPSSGLSRLAIGPRADDVTKFTTGLLHHTSSDRLHRTSSVPSTRNGYVTNCLTRNHLPPSPSPCCPAMLSSMNSLPLCQPASLSTLIHTLNYSTDGTKDKPPPPSTQTVRVGGSEPAEETVPEEKLSIFKRFKRAYKEHGKILVAVHVATSIVWYGSFYVIARGGVDIVPWLESWGFSETLIRPFRAGGLGDFAVAYLMYKLATPARYTVTLGGTNLVIRHLRNRGKMAPKSQEDSLRELYKEGKRKLKDSELRQNRLKRLRDAREKRKAAAWGLGRKQK